MRPWSIATIVAALLLLTSCSSFRSITPFQLGRRYRLPQVHIKHPSNNDDDYSTVIIDQFISQIQQSLDDETFESFMLKGPSVPRNMGTREKKKSNITKDTLDQQKEKLRGKYRAISGRLVLLQEKKKRRKGKKNETIDTLYVQCTIKYHLATDVAKNWRVVGKDDNIEQQNEVEVGLRQLFGHDGAPLSEWGAQNNINGEIGILSGELITSNGIYKLQLQPNSSFKLSKQKVSKKSSTQKQQVLSHDRAKNVPLDPSSLFLQKLGVSNKDGKPISGMSSKLRQCQKFVEIVGTIVNSNTNNKPSKIRVIDMGCGRGYLTFSLHSYLYNKFGSTSTQDKNNAVSIETKGIDRRPKLIAEINGIAQSLGDGFNNLKFVEGTIGTTNDNLFGNDSLQQNEQTDNSLDILIALHACDTATDDALFFAIDRNVDIIVTAPCCQHELRPQIDKYTSNNPSHPLSDVLRHAIYRERATETVTDSMRAILLEIAGYNVNVFEFIGGEHTAKNVMITAQKMQTKRSDKEQTKWLQDRRQKLISLAELYGIKRQRLATLMRESIVVGSGGGEGNKKNKKAVVQKNLSGMAPL